MSQGEETAPTKVARRERVCCLQDTRKSPICQKGGAWAWKMPGGQSLRNDKPVIIRSAKAQNDDTWSLETWTRRWEASSYFETRQPRDWLYSLERNVFGLEQREPGGRDWLKGLKFSEKCWGQGSVEDRCMAVSELEWQGLLPGRRTRDLGTKLGRWQTLTASYIKHRLQGKEDAEPGWRTVWYDVAAGHPGG